MTKELESTTDDLEVTAGSVQNNDQLEQEIKLPDKFKGKSLHEVVNSYQELEAAYGRQGKELGDYRRLADTFLQEKIKGAETTATTPRAAAEPEDDFSLDAPEKKAVSKLVEERVRRTDAELAAVKRTAMTINLERKHPDANEIVVTPEFQRWVGDSKYRLGLFQRANQNYDFDAADELFDTWKAINKASKVEGEVKDLEKEADKRKRINKLKTEGGSTGQAAGKIFSRKELIRLRSTDPTRYQMLAPEIRAAYAEGRVKD